MLHTLRNNTSKKAEGLTDAAALGAWWRCRYVRHCACVQVTRSSWQWAAFHAGGQHLHDVGDEAGLQLDAGIRVVLALTADVLVMPLHLLDWELSEVDAMILGPVQRSIGRYLANAVP